MKIKDTKEIVLENGDVVEFIIESGNTSRYWQGVIENGDEVYVPGEGVYVLSEGYTKIGSIKNGDYPIN